MARRTLVAVQHHLHVGVGAGAWDVAGPHLQVTARQGHWVTPRRFCSWRVLTKEAKKSGQGCAAALLFRRPRRAAG